MTERKTKLLIYFTALSAGALLISNLAAIKLWNFCGIAVDGGIVCFPLTYIISDLCVEFFHKENAKKIIYAGFLVNLIAVLVFYIVIALPAYPGWDMQEAYAAIFGFSPRIILGSLTGYLASNLLNNHLFTKMRQSDSILGRSFIARALCSSAFAHIVDSAVFETIAFIGVLSMPEFISQALFAYFAGLALEVLLSPIESLVERRLNKYVSEV